MTLTRSAFRTVLSRRMPILAAPRLSARNLSQSLPRRSAGGSHGHKDSSDMPWIIGSVGFTIPAVWYIMTSGSPKPVHAHPHGKTDTASSSPGNSQPVHEGQHGNLTKSDADKQHSTDNAVAKKQSNNDDATPEEERGASSDDKTADKGTSDVPASDIKEAATDAKDQAKEATSEFGEKAGGAKAKVEESTHDLTEKAEDVSPSKGGPDGENEKDKDSLSDSTSNNPAKTDPADTTTKSTNETSGKQEGLSNADTNHAVPHDERGDAVSKKPEDAHQPAKLEGTVDVNREKSD